MSLFRRVGLVLAVIIVVGLALPFAQGGDPPTAPDLRHIDSSVPASGSTTITGTATAVQASVAVRVTNTMTLASATTTAGTDGSFSVDLSAASDDLLALIATDATGTDSTPSFLTVRRSTALPTRPIGGAVNTTDPLATSLTGLFLMNEQAGTSTANVAASTGAATFMGTMAPSWNMTDPSLLMASGGYLDAGTAAAFDLLPVSQVTLVAKVYVNTVTATGIAEKNDGNGTDSGFVFGWDASGALKLTMEKSQTDVRVATANGVISSGQWLQVAFTWDGTGGDNSGGGNAHLFVNGSEVSKATSSNGAGTLGYTHATNQPFRIGKATFDSMAGTLDGKVAYVAVYRGRILSAAELSQLDARLPVTAGDVVQTFTADGGSTSFEPLFTGQRGQLRFTLSALKNVAVQVTNNTFSSVTVSLLRPDRSTVSSVTSSAAAFDLPVQFLASGTYTVLVAPAAGATGSLSVAVNTSAPTDPAAAVLDATNALSTSLVGLFVMDAGTGTAVQNLADGQSASFAGTTNNLPTWSSTEHSVVVKGGSSQNSYLNAGTDAAFDQLTTGKMTVAAKVYVTTVAGAGVAEKNDGNQTDSGFVFGWDSTGALRMAVEKSSSNMRVAAAGGTITTGTWKQVAFTWDGTVGTASAAHLFLNGSEVSKSTSADGSGTLGYTHATNQPFRIGNAGFDFAGSLNGRIAYLAVYKGRLLTTSELTSLDTQLSASLNNGSTSTMTVNSIAAPTSQTATAGATMSVAITQGPAQTTDWVGLFAVGAADGARLDWRYLNNSQTAPSTGMSSGTVTIPLPSTSGSYEFRFFTGTSTKLATSGTVVIPGASPTITVNGVPPPNGATVATGATVSVAVSSGSGSRTDWVGLAQTGAADTNYLAWQYLNGSTTAPATGLTNATLTFTVPAPIGSYELRWFANNGFTRIATGYVTTANPTVTVSVNSPSNGSTFVHPSSVTVGASTTVSGGTIDHVSFYAGSTLVGTATTSPYSVAWSNPIGGSYALTAAATDNVGHVTTSAAVTVAVTNGALDTPMASPAPGVFAANQVVTLAGPSGATVRYTTDGSTPTAMSPVYTGALTLSATTTVKAIAFESDWSPSAVMSATYQIDTAGPSITASTLPAPNAAGWHHGTVTVSFTCSDALSGVQSCPEPVVFDQEGANQQVTVHAHDLVGNDGSLTVTINIDKTAPTVTLSAPANPSTTTNASVALAASVADALSGATAATCNGTAATISSGSVSCNVNLRAGVNVVMVQVSDAAGNNASSSAFVTRTATASSIAVVPATRGLSVGDTVTLHALEDSGVSASSVSWSSDHTDVATVDTDGVVTGIGAGQATVTATASGLSAQATVTVAAGALAVGTTRWAVDPLPGVSGSMLVGVSGIDGTSLASVESTDGAAIIRGLTTEGEPTWNISVPLPSGESVYGVMGDVSGGVLLTDFLSIIRVDPAGSSSWRFASPDGIFEWAQAPDGTIFFTSMSEVTALDGATGQVKFAMNAPLSIRGCTGEDPFVPEMLGFGGLRVDARGRANVAAIKRWWDLCYTTDDAVKAILDVALYRIDPSGATTTVPVYHHEYTVPELRTPPAGWNPSPVATNTMPGDDGGTLVWWSPSIYENATQARAAYVYDTGTVATDYALFRPPVLSASGQIGYFNLPATSEWNDTETVAVQKRNLITGQVLWTASSSGEEASAATDDGWLQLTNQSRLSPDGMLDSSTPLGLDETLAFLGPIQVGASSTDLRKKAVVGPAEAQLNRFSASPQRAGSAAQRNAPPETWPTAEAAALAALRFIYPTSRNSGFEWGGLICYSIALDRFQWSRIVTDHLQNSVFTAAATCSPWGTTIADYHTHPSLERDVPSGGDIFRANQHPELVFYLMAPKANSGGETHVLTYHAELSTQCTQTEAECSRQSGSAQNYTFERLPNGQWQHYYWQ